MNKKFMFEAIKMAKKAFKYEEIPVGCVIVKDNCIISTGYNSKEKEKLSVSHAEINAIIKAEKKIGDWRLNECVLYTTLFPCPMCASAIQQARISEVYYILPCNNKYLFNLSKKILKNNKSNHCVKFKKINIDHDIMSVFFNNLRKKVTRET